MKKFLFLAATAALALSSCSSDDLVQGEQPVVEDGAVAFSAYVGRDTRATVINETELQKSVANGGGFGVFAYDQGTKSYTTYSSNRSYPNFMYNQAVTFASPNWTYSPVKYYNNNEGAKHSFFAYAPYKADVKSVFALGNAPAIRYSAATDDYDLLYAPAIVDIYKPGVTHKLDFNFKHALSKVSIYVAPFVDKVHETHTVSNTPLDGKTKIQVRSVKFVGVVASQALLSLEDGSWRFEATEESAYEINKEIELTGANNTSCADPTNTSDFKYKPVTVNKMVIPTLSGQPVQIQIVYDVITTDDKNSVNNSTITNTITSIEKFDLVQGTAYTFLLDLGMTSAKFNASVAPWNETKQNVDLPNNSNWHPITCAEIDTPTEMESLNKEDVVASTGLTANAYYYEKTTGILYKADASGNKGTGAATGYYTQGQDIYHVTTAGKLCTIETPQAYVVSGSYKVWVSSAWTDKSPTPVYSLNVKDGTKVQTGVDASLDSNWTPAIVNDYYTYEGKLYQWKTANDD